MDALIYDLFFYKLINNHFNDFFFRELLEWNGYEVTENSVVYFREIQEFKDDTSDDNDFLSDVKAALK